MLAGVRKTTSPSPVRSGRSIHRSRSPRERPEVSVTIENQFTGLCDEVESTYTQLITESGNLVSDRVSVDSLEQESGDNLSGETENTV